MVQAVNFTGYRLKRRTLLQFSTLKSTKCNKLLIKVFVRSDQPKGWFSLVIELESELKSEMESDMILLR